MNEAFTTLHHVCIASETIDAAVCQGPVGTGSGTHFVVLVLRVLPMRLGSSG